MHNIDPGGWTTFNEFFARHLKPGLRPAVEPENPSKIASPVDGVFDGDFPVNGDGQVIFVKGVPWSISQLLRGSKYADEFKNGKFTHSFLNTNDYHRQHAPVGGTVVEARLIQGAAYLEVIARRADNKHVKRNFSRQRSLYGNPDHYLQMERGLDAPDSPGYQFLQLRALMMIDSPIGLVAVLPIGMAQVSSVKLSCKQGDVVKKGQEISYFQFGGSDCYGFPRGCGS